MSKNRFIIVSHGAAATGFSRIAHGIIKALSPYYQPHHLAVNQSSDIIDGPWPIYGKTDYRDAYCLDRLDSLIESIKPEFVLFLHDFWFVSMYMGRHSGRNFDPKMLAYLPVDGQLNRPELFEVINDLDHVIAYNNFGHKEIDKIRALSKHPPGLSIVPHGIDLEDFYPLSSDAIETRRSAKIKYFGKEEADSFIVLNASKNQNRKRIDLTLEGFAQFAKDKPKNVKLYLHTGALFEGPDLNQIIDRLEIRDRILHTPDWEKDHPVLEEGQLNLLYNACDIGINSSEGEGWGLISFEHAATGAPQLVPDHSACKELWKDSILRLPITGSYELGGFGMLRKHTSIQHIATQLDRLYKDEHFRKEQAQVCYTIATNNNYRWENVAKVWQQLLVEIMTSKKAALSDSLNS